MKRAIGSFFENEMVRFRWFLRQVNMEQLLLPKFTECSGSLNDAFAHRHDNAIYPREISGVEGDKFITSPVSACLSIGDIKAGSVTFFPGVRISIARVLGVDNSFSCGKLFVFTLKPHPSVDLRPSGYL